MTLNKTYTIFVHVNVSQSKWHTLSKTITESSIIIELSIQTKVQLVLISEQLKKGNRIEIFITDVTTTSIIHTFKNKSLNKMGENISDRLQTDFATVHIL